jgi:putative membrane protein
MIRTKRSALLATAALALAAVTVAGCGSPSQYPHSKDSYGNTKSSDRSSDKSKSTTPTVASTLAPSGTTTVISPSQPASTTVLVPARPATTVLVPATTASPTVTTVGSTVLVPSTTQVTQVPASTLVGSDVDFMARASQFNATEIALSRVAYQKAQSAAVREFAMETINDHRRMSNDLDGVALRRNVSLAWAPSPAGSRAVDELSRLNGWDVDRYYLAQIIADHDAAAGLYASQGNLATDVTLRSTAGADAIDLRNRRDEALRLQSDIR